MKELSVGGLDMTNNSNEIQIRTLVENWAKAVREGDMEGVLAHHTDDIVMFDVPAPLQLRGYVSPWACAKFAASG